MKALAVAAALAAVPVCALAQDADLGLQVIAPGAVMCDTEEDLRAFVTSKGTVRPASCGTLGQAGAPRATVVLVGAVMEVDGANFAAARMTWAVPVPWPSVQFGMWRLPERQPIPGEDA